MSNFLGIAVVKIYTWLQTCDRDVQRRLVTSTLARESRARRDRTKSDRKCTPTFQLIKPVETGRATSNEIACPQQRNLHTLSVAHEPTRTEPIRVPVAWCNWEYYYSPLDGMLVHRRVAPSSMSPAPIYTPVGESFLSEETAWWQGLGVEPPTFRSEVQL